jgi:hypothetical protein
MKLQWGDKLLPPPFDELRSEKNILWEKLGVEETYRKGG